jgi:pyrroline-5-carboxylate reductase
MACASIPLLRHHRCRGAARRREAAGDGRGAAGRSCPEAASKPLILSVAAGKTIASFERHFGADAAVIRTIPNTPAAVGRGITAMASNANVSPAQLDPGRTLLSSIGEVVTVADEALIDAVTAVSGSGPAYVFYLTECLAAAGEKVGLPADLAMQLARATVAGSGELMRVTGTEAATLRQNVTSPKGTTYAALQVLMAEDGMQPLFDKAIEGGSPSLHGNLRARCPLPITFDDFLRRWISASAPSSVSSLPAGPQARLQAEDRFRPGDRRQEIIGPDHQILRRKRCWAGRWRRW